MAAEARDGDSSDAARLGVTGLAELGPAALRLGAVASMRAAGWATSSTMAGWRRLARAVRDREPPGALLDELWQEARGAARGALGVTDIEETLSRMTSDGAPNPDTAASRSTALRDRGAELLANSAEVSDDDDEEAHPAFGVVLEELSPDELRILRVLVSEGDQAAVDVEGSGPLGVGGTKVLRRRSRVAEEAGCSHPERLQLYLDNLLRVGLIRIGDEPLDEGSYDVLEAQPDVSEALEDASSGARRAKIVPLRIELSDFGRRFCETCLPLADGKHAPRPE